MKINKPFTTITTLSLDNLNVKVYVRYDALSEMDMSFINTLGEFVSTFKSANLDKINDMIEFWNAKPHTPKRIDLINPKNDNTISVEL